MIGEDLRDAAAVVELLSTIALARREDMHPLTLFDLAYDLVHEVVARAAAAEHR